MNYTKNFFHPMTNLKLSIPILFSAVMNPISLIALGWAFFLNAIPGMEALPTWLAVIVPILAIIYMALDKHEDWLKKRDKRKVRKLAIRKYATNEITIEDLNKIIEEN